ncbi:MAG: hypothetical protein RLZZ298_1379 [Pseudomonadota bacterium]|jgi:hypothetical protein
MYALELTVEIDENRQIHLQLPDTIPAQTVRVIVLYEENIETKGCCDALNERPEG